MVPMNAHVLKLFYMSENFHRKMLEQKSFLIGLLADI